MTKEEVLNFLNSNLSQPCGNENWKETCVKNPYVGCCIWGYDQHRGKIDLEWYNHDGKLQLHYPHIDLDDFENGSQYIDELYELLLKFHGWWESLKEANEKDEPLLMKQIQKEFDTLKDFYD